MTIGKILRIFSLTFVINFVTFPHVNCTRPHFRRCLESELSDILKIMMAIQRKDNRVQPMTEIETNKKVDEMLSLILNYLADGNIKNRHQGCLMMTRRNNDSNRKFFFWPWRPWRPQQSYGGEIFGGISGPFGLGISGGIGAGIYYPQNKHPIHDNTDYNAPANHENHNYGNIYPSYPTWSNGNDVGYDYLLGHNVGYDRTGTTNPIYGFHNNGYDRPRSEDRYYPSAGNYNEYYDYGGYYPPKYDHHAGHYFPSIGTNSQNNYNGHWNPVVNSFNKYPILEENNDRFNNHETNNHQGEMDRNDHHFYDPNENSHKEQWDNDDHEFYWDGGHEEKENHLFLDQDR